MKLLSWSNRSVGVNHNPLLNFISSLSRVLRLVKIDLLTLWIYLYSLDFNPYA